MQDEKLVNMANQIARFFEAYPEAEAMAGVRDHIESFWTPGMRRAMQARISATTHGIDPLVLRALAEGPPPGAATPVDRATGDAATLGQLATDAG